MIKPEELQVQHDKDAQEKAKELEKYFDARLKDKYEGMDKDIIIEAPESPKYKSHVVNYCLDEYRRIGWTVTYKTDQREGDIVIFKHVRPKYYSPCSKD